VDEAVVMHATSGRMAIVKENKHNEKSAGKISFSLFLLL